MDSGFFYGINLSNSYFDNIFEIYFGNYKSLMIQKIIIFIAISLLWIQWVFAISCWTLSNQYVAYNDSMKLSPYQPGSYCEGGVPKKMNLFEWISEWWMTEWHEQNQYYNWQCDDGNNNTISCNSKSIPKLQIKKMTLIESTRLSKTYEVQYTNAIQYCESPSYDIIGNTAITTISQSEILANWQDNCTYKFHLPVMTGSEWECKGRVEYRANFLYYIGQDWFNSLSTPIINIPICGNTEVYNTGTVSGWTGISVTISWATFTPPQHTVIDQSGSYLPVTFSDNQGNTYIHQSALWQLLAWGSLVLTLIWLLFRFIFRSIWIR